MEEPDSSPHYTDILCRLHQRSGSINVVDLHGRADEVMCMTCKRVTNRKDYHEQIITANPHIDFAADARADDETVDPSIRPDGDGNVSMSDFGGVCIPGCPHCNGVIKPTVVFFGDTVPIPKVESVVSMVRL
jgi:NAD-dependent SIR2 family protein deacetylase